MKKVSVITVCYNAANTIEDTLRSVLMQDYPALEYIVLDGLSTDGTLSILEKYRTQLSQLVSEKDNGIYDALNKAIKMATGDVVAILHADDLYTHKKVISDVMRQMEQSGADALYADLQYVSYADTAKVIRHWRSGAYRPGSFRWGWMPPHPTFFVKRALYQQYGTFNTSLRSAADYELMLRLVHKHKITLTYLPQTIVRMRVGGMSNRSLQNRVHANREDREAWQLNGLKSYPFTFLLKPLRKLPQFILAWFK